MLEQCGSAVAEKLRKESWCLEEKTLGFLAFLINDGEVVIGKKKKQKKIDK